MKKILFVVDENRRGGVSVALTDVIHALEREACEMDVLVLHDQGEMLHDLPCNVIYGTPFFEAIDYNFKQVLQKKDFGLLLKKVQIVFGLKTGWIKQKIRKERRKILTKEYDVEVAFKDGFPAIFTACGDVKKKVHWLHSEYKKVNSNSKYESLFQEILPKFDTIIAVSKGVEEQFNGIYHLKEKTMVIPNIVWEDAIREKADQEKVEFSTEKINVIMVGRCHPDKGYMRCLEVIKEMCEEGELKDILFHIVGDGPEKEQLQEYVTQENLQEYVEMHGAKTNPYCYMKAADCMLLPSVNESFGLVIVEAEIVGIPVVATENAATGELIAQGETGLIVENSKQGIREGIKQIQNRGQIEQFRENLKDYSYNNLESIAKIKEILEV